MRTRISILSFIVVLISSCSSRKETGISCYVERGSTPVCTEYLRPIQGREGSIRVSCRDVGGRLVAGCPEERNVGSCTVETATMMPWTLSEGARTHYYLHPDDATPEAIARLRNACKGTWTPGPGQEK